MKILNLLKIITVPLLINGCVRTNDNIQNTYTGSPPAPFMEKQTRDLIKASPKMEEDGIFAGDKGILIHKTGKIDLMISARKTAEFFFYFRTPYSPWITTNYKGLKNCFTEKKLKDKKFVFTAGIPLEKQGTKNMPLGKYHQEIKLLDDGRIKFDIEYSTPPGLGKKIQDRCLFFLIPFPVCQGKSFKVNGKISEFPNTPGGKGLDLYSGKMRSFVFAPNTPGKSFSIDIENASGFWIRDRENGKINFRILPDKKNRVSFLLNLGKISKSSLESSSDKHAGIDFWKNDRLHVPDYSKSHNLIQNPSFEAGLRYWTLHNTWGNYQPGNPPVYTTDSAQKKFGNNSLLINVFKGPQPSYLQTFAIPVVEGKKYTVSLYAKGNKAKGLYLDMRCITGRWMEFPKIGTCRITENWKRYCFTFTAPNRAVTILLRPNYYGKDSDARIRVDGFQLNEGDKALEYEEKPLKAILLTSNPDNFLDLKGPINARLKIITTPETEGRVACGIEDYFYRKIWKQEFSFKTDKAGIAIVKLPIDDILQKGIFVLQADFKLENGHEDTDFFRISRMKFLDGTQRNKNIFSSNIHTGIPRTDDLLERCRQIGFGSTNYVKPEKKFTELFKKYNIEPEGLGIFSHGKKASKEMTQKIKNLYKDVKQWKKMTPEREKIIEEAAYEVAKSMPWINSWFFAGECEAGGGSKFKMMEAGNIEDFVKFFMATFRGVKRFDPTKKVYLCGGPCNMMPQGGIRWLDRYLTLIDGKIKFDGIAIHPYRTVPENPDLDDDTGKLLEMLDKHGYSDVPIYWNEGIYYTYYNIPAWGLSPHKGCSTDHYRAYCPSYHMGWAERISAAYFARSWLVALKYQDRVKQSNGWCSWIYMDAYLTPFALQKIPNTLGNILGNATFKKDIRFAPGIRCYVFEDEKNRPVAALWSHIPKVDYGLEQSPIAEISFDKIHPEFIDLMGNEWKVKTFSDGRVSLSVMPAPLFIRGKAGTMEQFCKSLMNAKLQGTEQIPLQIGVTLANDSELKINLKNLISRNFHGKIDLEVQGKKMNRKINLKSQHETDLKVSLKNKIAYNQITKVDIPGLIEETGQKPISFNASFSGFAVKKRQDKITIDGNLDDWRNIPEIKLRNRNISKFSGGTSRTQVKNTQVGYPGDFEASFKMSWDNDNLYLAVNVIDDDFVRLPDKHGRFNWYNDTLQVYIDTLCDARSKSTKGFDGNDYNYDFFPDPQKRKAVAFRRFAPEQQIAGGLLAPKPNEVEPNVKNCFKITENGYLYEIAFPKRYIAPLQLKNNSVCGFAIYLNDRDGKHIKAALTLTPPGTGGYMSPHLYPVMILTE